MAAQSIGVRIALEGAGDYVRDLKTIIQETKTLKTELELASRIKNPFERSTTMKGVLTSEISAQEEKVRLLREAYDQAENSTGKFSEKTLKARDALDKAEIALDSMKTQLRDLPNGLEMAGDDILKGAEKYTAAGNEFKMAAQPFWGATGAVVAGLITSAKITAEFEQQMAAVKAVTNATEEDMEALVSTARQLGESTKFKAVEAGEAFEYLGRAGFDAQQSIAMADSVLALAAADAIGFGDAANVTANMMHIFGLAVDDLAQTQENAAHVADVLAQASRSANTDVLTIAESAKYAAPSFAALGWTIEDMAFAIDLAADYGVKGSQAGTGLRQAFKNLEDPADKVRAAMNKYGITLDDGTGKALTFSQFMDQLRGVFSDLEIDVMDANGELKDGEVIMEEYGNSLPITQMEKLQAVAAIFGTRAMPTVLAMIESGADKYDELSEAIYNADGAAKEMQDTMIDTAQGDITILISELQELALSFGELLLPVLRDGLAVAKDVVNRLNEMDEGTRRLILKASLTVAAIAPVLSGIGGIISGIGGMMNVGGHLVKGVGNVIHLISGAGGMVSNLTALKGGMDSATTAAGILSGAKGIGSVIATAAPFVAATGLIIGAGVLVVNNWDSIKEAAKVLGEEIGYHWGNIRSKTSEVWQSVKDTISSAWSGIKDMAGNALRAIGSSVSDLLSGVRNAASSIRSIFSGLVKNAKSWGADLIENFAGNIKNNISRVTGTVKSVAQTVKNYLGFSEPDKGPLSDFHTYMPDMMKLMAQGIKDGIPMIRDAVNSTAYALLPQASYIDLPAAGNSYQTNMGGVTIQVYAQPGQDVDDLAEAIEERLVAMEERRMYAYG